MTLEPRLTREQAIDIAREVAKHMPKDYVPEDVSLFQPHEWVIEAILRANARGYVSGYEDGYSACPCGSIADENFLVLDEV